MGTSTRAAVVVVGSGVGAVVAGGASVAPGSVDGATAPALGLPWPVGGRAEGSLPNPSWSPVMGSAMAAARRPSTATSGARFTDGVCQRCDDAPSGRADGASGKAGDGGPDRIRTGD